MNHGTLEGLFAIDDIKRKLKIGIDDTVCDFPQSTVGWSEGQILMPKDSVLKLVELSENKSTSSSDS